MRLKSARRKHVWVLLYSWDGEGFLLLWREIPRTTKEKFGNFDYSEMKDVCWQKHQSPVTNLAKMICPSYPRQQANFLSI